MREAVQECSAACLSLGSFLSKLKLFNYIFDESQKASSFFRKNFVLENVAG